MNSFHETVLTLNKFWRWFTADLIVHSVRRVFFLTLSGISCVTILKYTLILSPQFTRKYRKQNKQPKRKLVRQIILEINSLDMQTHRNFLFSVVSLLFIIIFFSLTHIFYLALSQSEFPMNNCINVNLIYIL